MAIRYIGLLLIAGLAFVVAGSALVAVSSQSAWGAESSIEHPTGVERAKADKPQKESGKESDDATAKLNPVTVEGKTFPFDLSIWTAAVFLIVLAILYKAAWGPISRGLDQREQNITSQIDEAHRRNEEARQLLADYEKRIAAANEESRRIIEEGRRNSDRLGQELIAKAKEEAAAEVQRGKQQIAAATTSALHEIATSSSEMAVELAGKIVRQRLTAADHAQLIADAVSKFKSQATGSVGKTPV